MDPLSGPRVGLHGGRDPPDSQEICNHGVTDSETGKDFIR